MNKNKRVLVFGSFTFIIMVLSLMTAYILRDMVRKNDIRYMVDQLGVYIEINYKDGADINDLIESAEFLGTYEKGGWCRVEKVNGSVTIYDIWGSKMELQLIKDNRGKFECHVISLGPDRKLGTKDDISYPWK